MHKHYMTIDEQVNFLKNEKKLKNLHFFVDIRFWIWYIIYALSKKGVKMIFEN